MPDLPDPKRAPLPPPSCVRGCDFSYAELQVTSNFSFLRGASHPDELIYQAAELGYRAIALTDRNTLAGMVRAHSAAKSCGMKLVVGARVEVEEIRDGGGRRMSDEATKRRSDGGGRGKDEGKIELLVWAPNREAYGSLCQLLTLGKKRVEKGDFWLSLDEFLNIEKGLLVGVVIPTPSSLRRFVASSLTPSTPSSLRPSVASSLRPSVASSLTSPLSSLLSALSDRLSLIVSCSYSDDDEAYLRQMMDISRQTGIPLLATNDVHYHDPNRRALQDVLTCVRHGCTIQEAGFRLFPNGERYLKSPEQMHRLFAACPQAIERGLEIADRCEFKLSELRYEYPDELVPKGYTPFEYLEKLTWEGVGERFGEGEGISDEVTKRRSDGGKRGGISDEATEVRSDEGNGNAGSSPSSLRRFVAPSLIQASHSQLHHELSLIKDLKYEAYFLTVYDLVKFARSRGILCQGRGSAANSAVCYYIGITSVNPTEIDLLFERFISKERDEPPDIDVDFEHERREEVIQYVYQKYGRDRSGMCATLITYRGRSAIRDVGKAMGLSLDQVDAMAKRLDWWHRGALSEQEIRDAGVDPNDPTVQRTIALVTELLGFPRHLGQHTGGMIMTRGLLCEMVPIENASMEDRTVVEWDKDDVEELGLLKVDVLGLGMLTCISKAFRFLEGMGEDGRSGEGGGDQKISDGATKRRSDEGECEKMSDKATKARSDGGECGEISDEGKRGKYYGEGANISGSGGLAEGKRAEQADLYCYTEDAGRRAIWTNESDASRLGFHSIEYCRGACTPESTRLLEISSDITRFIGRTNDTDRNCLGVGINAIPSDTFGPSGRNRSRVAGADSKLGEQAGLVSEEAGISWETGISDGATKGRSDEGKENSPTSNPPSLISPHSPPSLRPFVASSLISSSRQHKYELRDFPPTDPKVFDMICKADTIGVFQIESRAQMSMLPRLKPRSFYDLVIEVAIVRPGPIQGNMVHPYLRRRCGLEPVRFPSKALEKVLKKTLGVPLFQEQAMKVVMVAAGFTAGEADQLRRAMAAWRKNGAINKFYPKIINGMLANGYTREFAESTFQQIQGFGEYGFPESHSASFALLVYVSAWIKCHHPAVFCAALLNSQPMGFYAPAQIVRDAREHGVEVLPVDVNGSGWDCSLENKRRSDEATERRRDPAVRLGFREIKGFSRVFAQQIEITRSEGIFRSIVDFHQRTGLPRKAIEKLAEADCFGSLGLTRRQALWQVLELDDAQLPLFTDSPSSLRHSVASSLIAPPSLLPPMPLPQEVKIDYQTTSLSLKKHPVALIREALSKQRILTSKEVNSTVAGKWVKVAGLVLVRQRPGTASGIVFITLEDETGVVNLIVRPNIWEKYRAAARHAGLLQCDGYVERQGEVVHLMAKRLFDRSEMIAGCEVASRDFH